MNLEASNQFQCTRPNHGLIEPVEYDLDFACSSEPMVRQPHFHPCFGCLNAHPNEINTCFPRPHAPALHGVFFADDEKCLEKQQSVSPPRFESLVSGEAYPRFHPRSSITA